MLSELERDGEVVSITPFLSKLLAHVRKEIAYRRGEEAKPILTKQAEDSRLPSASVVISPTKTIKIKQTQSAIRRASSPSPSFVVFSSPKLKSSSFRSRAKQAKASLQARSNEAVTLRRRQEQHDRTRQAVDTMRTWHTKRDKARKLREEILNEERRLRKERWNARIEREKQVHTLMQAAAEDAKSKALESGCSSEEALVEAAAAASRVVDDESTTFQCVDTHSDDGSFTYDDCTYEENIPCVLSSSAIDSNANPRTKSLGLEEVTSLTLKKIDSAQNTTIYDVDDTTSNILTVVTECEACPSDTKITFLKQLDSSLHSKESLTRCAISTRSETNNETSSDAFNAYQEENLCYENVEEHLISVPDTHAINKEQIELKMEPAVVFSPMNETHQVQSATGDERSFRTDMKSTESIARERRSNCIFPSLSSIFADHGGHQKETNNADEKQRKQSRLFQYHIEQYSKMRTTFAAIIEDAGCHSCDDPDCCDDSFAQGLFYRIHSNRPEVMSIIRKAFSDRQLSAWNELPSDVEGNVWNLLWVWGLPKASIFDNLLIFQKINRFRDTRGLVSHKTS